MAKFVRDDDGMWMPAFCIAQDEDKRVSVGDKIVVTDTLVAKFPTLFAADKEYDVIGFDDGDPVIICENGEKMYVGHFEIKRVNGEEER
jgi:hypothetical protein